MAFISSGKFCIETIPVGSFWDWRAVTCVAYGKYAVSPLKEKTVQKIRMRFVVRNGSRNEAMGLFDEDIPKKPQSGKITVGEDLARLSEDELSERITALTEEINRTQQELEQRSTIRDAADSVFR
ncbi:MAG: DUF1192 domain-containing protein [Roseibium sp.]|uniref:DUF1192 domain-containing protein n=1 Tax=Roseibium sp. TaxID=1936156 RepID=UPI003D9C4366